MAAYLTSCLHSTVRVRAFQSEAREEGDPHLKKLAKCQKWMGLASDFMICSVEVLLMRELAICFMNRFTWSMKSWSYSVSIDSSWESRTFFTWSEMELAAAVSSEIAWLLLPVFSFSKRKVDRALSCWVSLETSTVCRLRTYYCCCSNEKFSIKWAVSVDFGS